MRNRGFQLALVLLVLVGIGVATWMCKVSEEPKNSPELHAQLLSEWNEMPVGERWDFCLDWVRMGGDRQTEVAIERSRDLGHDEGEGVGTAFPFFLSKCSQPEKLPQEEM